MRILLCILLTTTPAWADLIDPEVEGCRNAAEGDACELENGTMGTCRPGECCRLDYSADAETPPSVCSPCVRCSADMPDSGAMEPSPGGMADNGPAAGGHGDPGVDRPSPSGGMVANEPQSGDESGSTVGSASRPDVSDRVGSDGATGNGGESAGRDDDENEGSRSSQSPVVHCSAGAATDGGVGFVALFFGLLLALSLRRGR